jgi:hypothetical protein
MMRGFTRRISVAVAIVGLVALTLTTTALAQQTQAGRGGGRGFGGFIQSTDPRVQNRTYKEYPGVTHGPIIGAAMPDIFAFFKKHTKK